MSNKYQITIRQTSEDIIVVIVGSSYAVARPTLLIELLLKARGQPLAGIEPATSTLPR